MGTLDEEEPMIRPNGGEEKIFVSVRLRPLNEKEITINDVSDWECINDDTIMYRNSLSVSERSMYPTAYSFDRVFGPDCSTRQVYEEGAKEVALSVVRGINTSVFAYGQTSSGKTYTMSGITEYTVADIYDYIEAHKEREFVLKFSAMEIYNESVRDLLSTDTTPLRLLDDPERGTVVERLTEETLMSWNHFKQLLSVCEAQRQIGETNLNEASSRSHQILRLSTESSAREFLGNDKSSILTANVNFVDLAGSERASQSLSAGMRLKEGCHINRSLLTLGTVIRKLSKSRSGHVPFRDSKLTRILQSSLGGNARTAIICTLSPARIHVEQSRNTLLFASCAKEVTTNAQVNVVVSDKALVKQLQRELARLESELRGAGPRSVTLDSTELLKDKDLQIEKLIKEVAELTRQLEDARSQLENLLREAENDRSLTIWADPDHQYPKLRVRNLCGSEKSFSTISEDPQSLDIGVRSLNASQCSDGRSSASSEENFVALEDFKENFNLTSPSTLPSISPTHFTGGELHGKDAEEKTLKNLGHYCKEVQCIKVEDSSTKSYANSSILESSPDEYLSSNLLESSPNPYAYSNVLESTPDRHSDLNTSSRYINTGASGLTEVENNDRVDPEPWSPQLEEQKQLKSEHSDIIVPSSGKPSPWLLEEGSFSSRSMKMIKSRSCRARIMSNFPTYWLDKLESNESTPPFGFEKDYGGRSEGFQIKLSPLGYGVDSKSLSKRGSRTSADDTIEDIKVKSVENETDLKSNNDSEPDAGTTWMTDQTAQEAKLKDKTPRNVKDVGLDPIQDDVVTVTKWPSEFKRLQRDIIDLWYACNISLVHRSYFFLLFKGDSSDSFYMEVEFRRMSFLKDTFTKGHATMVDGRTVSPSSSKRALNQERQMLSREMSKRFTTEERENLFLKWGIPLNGNQRRLQLAHRLWTSTTDMDNITQSANLVSKLVGFEEQQHSLREMFGLLNFAPNRLTRKKKPSSIWQRTIKTLL